MANAGIERRRDISIASHGDTMAGWLYPSAKYSASTPGPAIVLAHGLGGVKEMRLDVYADKFNQLGYTCVVFDYRFSGQSTGKPRNLVDFACQQADWDVAIAYTRALEQVDAERVAIFGTSFGGGHVIQAAARDSRLKAVISQCPFTDGIQSAMTTGVKPLPWLLALGLRDLLFGTDDDPVLVPLVGSPGEAALMNAPDVAEGHLPLIPAGIDRAEKIPARIIMKLPFLCPGAYAAKVTIPLFVAVCALDSVAPAKPTIAYAKRAKRATVKVYDDMGHFDIYVGEKHERAFADYAAFLKENVPA